MGEYFFDLSKRDRADALEVAAGRVGRSAELLEKDIWVVWTLDALFRTPLGDALTFKGGTSLSKAYRVIDRFSEDVDLTYDIRALLPEFAEVDGDPIPPSASQANRITKEVRGRLPAWVGSEPREALEQAVVDDGLAGVEVRVEGTNLVAAYPSAVPPASDYVRAEVLVEFGARSSGRPAAVREVTCDAAPHLKAVSFPTAWPSVMAVERTFWEKATAAHVYCLQKRLRSERFARHWYDLAELEKAGVAEKSLRNRDIGLQVARHKTRFFREKSAEGTVISYRKAVDGNLLLVPEDDAGTRLAEDYDRMLTSGLLPIEAPSFHSVMDTCRAIQERANRRLG
ncbi:MAG: nucleotidyl transferase AbiEii/AbiGii toxin family protein [Gemmatimonadota bacterium]